MSATIVVDLGFGDAGKGSTVDFLCRQNPEIPKTVVRFNGGSQAGHNVVLPDGTHHTFSQFGSGAFAGARTHLSRFMIIDPLAMENEARHLREVRAINPYAKLTVDENALVVTPYHREVNLRREAENHHGTCGLGIGACVEDSLDGYAIRAGDLWEPDLVYEKLERIRRRHAIYRIPGLEMALCHTINCFRIVDGGYLRKLAEENELIFEGAQGVLLDEWYGFHPHTTWSTCTDENARTLLREIGYSDEIAALGLTRSYMTRHGAGPFPSESDEIRNLELHNHAAGAQGKFRVGYIDLPLLKYAVDCCEKIDGLVVSHLDQVEQSKVVVSHGAPLFSKKNDLSWQSTLTAFLMEDGHTSVSLPVDIVSILESMGIPIVIKSWGPTHRDKQKFFEGRMAG